MDPMPRVWFDALEGITMKPFERLTHRVTFRAGTIVLAVLAVLTLTSTTAAVPENVAAIRPFRVNVPEADLADLRRRVLATRWPDRETVTDQSQGAQLERLKALVSYWSTGYDWRKVEAKLNAL